jgi:hypothetical protein
MPRDITKEVNELIENHGNDLICELQDTNDIAAMLYQSYSDSFKSKNGYRPCNRNLTVKECTEAIKNSTY